MLHLYLIQATMIHEFHNADHETRMNSATWYLHTVHDVGHPTLDLFSDKAFIISVNTQTFRITGLQKMPH